MRSVLFAIAAFSASAATAGAAMWRPAPAASGAIVHATQGGTLQAFTDETSFYDAVGDSTVLAYEDFESGPTPPGGIDFCNEPVSSASHDMCFSPGDLVPGFAITSSGGSGIVVLGAGFLGGFQTSKVIGANIYTEWTIVTFAAPVIALSADLYGGRGVRDSAVVVEAFDTWGNSLGTASVTPASPDSSAFLGLISGTPIARITITAANDGGELLDNLRFGLGDTIFADGFDGA